MMSARQQKRVERTAAKWVEINRVLVALKEYAHWRDFAQMGPLVGDLSFLLLEAERLHFGDNLTQYRKPRRRRQ